VLIDWFTVCAQAINFLILVWLLQRYLYKPVLAAIDAREKRIAAMIADAAAQDARGQTAAAELRSRNEAFDHEREGLMQKATQEGATERQRLFEAARQDSALLRANLAQALGAERAELANQLSQRTRTEVFAMTRKALSELAGTGLADRMIDILIERLQALPPQQRQSLAAREVLVRSAFDPSDTGRTKLAAAIRDSLGQDAVARFQTAPELICGLELSVAGNKLAWSVADYLSTLAQDAAAIAATELAAPPEAPAHAD
jgi:F-type H+-transporting ATPase subunit b